jgi:hypothetical protein
MTDDIKLSEDVKIISEKMSRDNTGSKKSQEMVIDGFRFELGGRYRLSEAFMPPRASKALKIDSLVQILEIKNPKTVKVFGVYEGQTFDLPWGKLKKEEV